MARSPSQILSDRDKKPSLTSTHIFLPSPSPQSPQYHIIFIPGNPGLINFYKPFLTELHRHLTTSPSPSQKRRINIYGFSLANFVNDDDNAPEGKKGVVLDLRGQIEFVEECVEGYLKKFEDGDGAKVVIVGHSVGAYIGLEVLRRWRERERERGRNELGSSYRIVGFVGLWPTVTWISRSPSGKRVGWLLSLPFFATAVSTFAHLLTRLLNHKLLLALVKAVTGMPEDPASVIVDFIQDRVSVKQALTMARHEMNEINEDTWDEDLWGAATPTTTKGPPRPKLVFYFGQNDHWVADHMRDELIAARGGSTEKGREKEKWRPKMLVDDLGIPHAFCIRHSSVAAQKTAGWAEEMIDAETEAEAGETSAEASMLDKILPD